MIKKALIALSGGVDSSVAALLMKECGYKCIGTTMHLFDNDNICVVGDKTCCSLADVEDARSVANVLSIPYYVFNFTDEFKNAVINPFIAAYDSGRTPNPCIDCNRHLKFAKLFSRTLELDFDFVVTGHYARTAYDEKTGRYLLKVAVDKHKDQTYVLYELTQEQLACVQFPLGGMNKARVREIAEKHGFINADKRDSQDICFVPDGDYAAFIEAYTKRKYPVGDFVLTSGEVIGQHDGIIRYTIGQRRGLGIAYSEPLYVVSKDIEKNIVVLGTNDELFSSCLTANGINLISVPYIDGEMRMQAKVRYAQTAQAAVVRQISDDRIEVVFDEPQRAIAAGQAVVMYDGDVVVGGGRIE